MPAAVAIPAIIGAAGVGAQIYGASKAAGASKSAANIQSQAAQQVANSATQTANDAAAGMTGATSQANDLLSGQMSATQGHFDPYNSAGQEGLGYLKDLLAPGGGMDEKFAFQFNPAEDPGYQFRLQEGQKALENSAAARGGALSGGALKGIAGYSQGLASQEFQNSFNRALQGFQANQQSRATRLAGLTGLAGMGLNAAGQQADAGKYFTGLQSGNLMQGAQAAGQFRMGGQEIAGNALMGGANAQAAGKVGAANAWNQGIGGALNSGTNAVYLWDIMRRS